MLKKVYFVLSLFVFAFSSVAYSCTNSLDPDNPNFCTTFEIAAQCYCSALRQRPELCADIHKLGSYMIGYFGTIERACKSQHNTPTQDCIDGWTCYLYGGVDSRNRACSSTGSACPRH